MGKDYKGSNIRPYLFILSGSVICRWFTHFYAWGVIWDCCILAYISEQQWRFGTCQFEVVLALAVQTLQVTRRFLECVCISVFSSSKMHILHHLVGVFFYTWNGPTILSQFTMCSDEADTKLQLQWYHFTGVLLFIYASYHQYKCHSILANIRTGRDGNTYGLPKGDWFELLTSSHYFAEILIYTGIAMVQGFKNVWTIAPVIITTLLLLIGAKLTHEWYTEKYREECSKRRVLIPYIY
ncbi:polyprenol reductase-like [Dysidea avara]|uniref:polyprenol reductase-like n=1 Tax=Dysidea avara TaxID=196820 RepID=UPI0033309B8C